MIKKFRIVEVTTKCGTVFFKIQKRFMYIWRDYCLEYDGYIDCCVKKWCKSIEDAEVELSKLVERYTNAENQKIIRKRVIK